MRGLSESKSVKSIQRNGIESSELKNVRNDNSKMEENHSGEKNGSIKSDTPEMIIQRVELKKSISFFGIVAILLANIGGTGIFIAPTSILSLSGSPGLSIIMWFFGGIIQAGLAFSVIEIALMFNKAGGPYYFIYDIFGDLAAFIFMWGFLIFIAAPVWALCAYTTSLYALTTIYIDCPPPEGLVKMIAAWVLVSLIAINCTYMKVITLMQKFLTACKIVALVIIIVIGLVCIPTEWGRENINHLMDGSSTDVGKLALALFGGYYAFGGWPIITILAEEVKKPEKNVPKGLGVSFAVLILTMVAANFAFYTVLSKEEAMTSDAVALLFGQMIHPSLPIVLAVLICLCSVGVLNVLILGQPRMIFAAGRNGHMPKIMTMLHNKFNTPWPATFSLGILAIIMLVSGSVMSLMTTVSLYAGFMTFLLMMCVLVLRWKRPDAHRPIKVPLVLPIFCSILTVSLMLLSVIEKPTELGLVAIVIVMGVPVYYVCVKWQRPKKLFSYIDVLGFYLQVCLQLSYESK